MVYMMEFFVILALCIVAYSTYALKEKSTQIDHTENQNNTRELYIIHHRRVLLALIFAWAFPCLNNNRILKNAIDSSWTAASETMQYISFFFMMLTGTFVNLVRLS